MPSTKPLSRSELSALVGVDENTMILWLRHDLIQPDGPREGRGKHLRYPFYEANIAAVLLHLRKFGSNIEALKGVAGIYREAIRWGQSNKLSSDDVTTIALFTNGALHNQTERYRRGDPVDHEAYDRDVAVHRMGLDGKYKLTDDLLNLALTIDFHAYLKHGTAFREIMSQPVSQPMPYPTYFWPTPDGWKRGDGKEGQLRASFDGVFATIAIDIIGILSGVWIKS